MSEHTHEARTTNITWQIQSHWYAEFTRNPPPKCLSTHDGTTNKTHKHTQWWVHLLEVAGRQLCQNLKLWLAFHEGPHGQDPSNQTAKLNKEYHITLADMVRQLVHGLKIHQVKWDSYVAIVITWNNISKERKGQKKKHTRSFFFSCASSSASFSFWNTEG